MNIFKPKTVTWWQFSILKIAVGVIGIAIGSTWPEIFSPYALVFVIIGIALGIYLWTIWMKD